MIQKSCYLIKGFTYASCSTLKLKFIHKVGNGFYRKENRPGCVLLFSIAPVTSFVNKLVLYWLYRLIITFTFTISHYVFLFRQADEQHQVRRLRFSEEQFVAALSSYSIFYTIIQFNITENFHIPRKNFTFGILVQLSLYFLFHMNTDYVVYVLTF